MLPDLRFAGRRLLKSPGFTATALTTLALCFGATLTIFAVVDSVLLRPLPFPDADRLVTVYNTYPKAGVDRDGASLPNYYERRGQIAAFSDLAIIRPDTAIVGEPGSTERIDIARISPEFFQTLGVAPILGRSFAEEETTLQNDGVAILDDAYWRRQLHADPQALGRTIRMDGVAKKIVGILPPGFRFLSAEARVYLPYSSDPSSREPAQRHSGNQITMIARLRPGVSATQAEAEIAAHNAGLAASYPQAKMIAEVGFRSVVTSLHADHVQSLRPMLLLLEAGVLLLLLIGSVNLINLLLIRASSRAKELAIRQSMGATRGHVIREVLAETMLLAVLGGLGGLIVAAFGLELVRVLGAERLPLAAHLALDGRVATAALLGTVVLGAVFALPVVWFNLRTHVANALQSSSRTSTASHAAQRLRHMFIVAQIALAFVLLSGAGLLGLSLQRALAVSPGFRPDHVLSGQLTLPWKNYHGAAYLPFAEKLTAELSGQPGVIAAGLTTKLPLSGAGNQSGKSAVTVKGHAPRPGETVRAHYTYGVMGDYFAALGIPLQQGRFIDTADSHRTARVCVVDEDFVRHYWPTLSSSNGPNSDALGQRLFLGSRESSDTEAFTVVGVVGAVKQTDLTDNEALGTAYVPLAYRSDLQLFVVTRTSLPPESLGPTLRSVLRGLDPELPLSSLKTMDARLADSLIARRSPALLAGLFAGVALLLAAIGTDGVLSYAVAQREREIGVRLALGAQTAQIGRQFLSLGVRLLAAGTVLGVAGAWLAGRAMQTILFDVPALHPATLAATAAIMSTVALLACWLPARRASRVDPMVALRSE
ncbi:MAG: ABC transporter permease [Opitutae bacterium]|nr:ABC transporter permease [Opitutae bacterium]